MMHKRLLLTGAKLAIGIGLLAVLFTQISFATVVEALRGAHGSFLLGAFASYVIASGFEAAKFRAACESKLDWPSSVRLVLMGLFFNNFLPSNIGGDGYKLFRLKQAGFSAAAAIVYLLTDRMAGAVVLVIAGGLCWLFTDSGRAVLDPSMLHAAVFSRTMTAALLAAVALAMVAAAFLLKQRIRHAWHRLEGLLHAGVKYLRNTALPVLLLSSCFHLFRGLAIHQLARAFGYDVSVAAIMVMLGIALTVSMLPISLGGLGVREGTLSLLLKHAGLPAGTALAIALLNLAVLWTKSLIGGLIFMRVRHLPAEATVHTVGDRP
jgi:hypothetical protein